MDWYNLFWVRNEHYLHLLFELRFRKSKSLDGDVKGIPAELRTDPLSASWICAVPRWYPLERNLSWSKLVNPGHSPSLRGRGWKAGLCVTVTHCAVGQHLSPPREVTPSSFSASYLGLRSASSGATLKSLMCTWIWVSVRNTQHFSEESPVLLGWSVPATDGAVLEHQSLIPELFQILFTF